jgi:hypothetical protein
MAERTPTFRVDRSHRRKPSDCEDCWQCLPRYVLSRRQDGFYIVDTLASDADAEIGPIIHESTAEALVRYLLEPDGGK